MESQASMLYKFSRIVPEDVEVDEDIPVTFLDAFEGNRVRVGRGNPRYRKENEILCVSPSKHVSRTHCILEFRNGDWFIIDYGSSNGTFVNMLRIETSDEDKKKLHYRKLQNKDIVGLGVEGFDEDDEDRKFSFPVSEYYIFQFEKICIKNEKQRQSVRAAGLGTATGASSSEVVVDLDSLSDTTSRTSNNTRKRRESETTQAVASDVEILSEEDKLKPKKSVRFQPSKDLSSGSTSPKDGKKEASGDSNRSKSKQGSSLQSNQTSQVVTLNDSSQDDTDVGQAVVQKKKKKYSGNNGTNKNDSVDNRKREQSSRKSNSESDIEIVRECKSPKKKSSMKRVSERDSDSETRKKKQSMSKSVSQNHKKSSKSESTDDDSDGESDDRKEYKKAKPKEKGTPKISNLGRAVTVVDSSENSGSESDDRRTRKNRMKYSQPKQSEKSSQKKRRSDEDLDFESDHKRKKDKLNEMQKDKKKLRIDFDNDDQESEDSSSDSEPDKAKRRKKSTKPFHSAAVKKASPQKKSTSRKLQSETESNASSDLDDFQTSSSKKNSNGNRTQTANSRTLDGFIVADDYVERRSRQKWPKKTNTSSSRINGNKTSRVEASSNNDSSKLKKKAAKRGDIDSDTKTKAKNGKVVDKNSSESEESDEEVNIVLLPSKKGKELSKSDSVSDAKKWKYREGKENSSNWRKDISNRNSSKQRQALKSANPENMDDSDIEIMIKANQKISVLLANRKRQLSLEVNSGEDNNNSKKPKSQSLKESEPVSAKQRIAHAQSRHVIIQRAANQNDSSSSSTSSSETEIPLWKLKEMEQQMRYRTPWIQLREPFEYDQDDDSYSLEWSPAMKQQLTASAMDKMEKQYLVSRRKNAQVLKTNKQKKRQRPRRMEPEFYYDRGTIRVKEPIMPKQTSNSRSRPSTSGSAGASRKRRSSEVESDSSVVSSVMAVSAKSENSNSSKIRRVEKPAEDEHIETLDIESDSTPQEGVDANIDSSEIDEPEDTNDPGGQSESNMEIGDDNNNVNASRTYEPRRKAQMIDRLPHAPMKGLRFVEAPPRAPGLSRKSQTPILHPQSLKQARKDRLKEIVERDKQTKFLQNVEKEVQQLPKPKVRVTLNTRQDNLVKDMQKSSAGTQ